MKQLTQQLHCLAIRSMLAMSLYASARCNFPLYSSLFSLVNFILLRTGGEIRTPINGFGDRYSTLELHPFF